MQQVENEGVGAQFGRVMRERREEEGWSQRKLAELLAKEGLKIDHSAINRIESNQREVRLQEAVAIAGLLGFKLDALSWSETAEFLRHETRMVQGILDARQALLEALRSIDRAVNVFWDDSQEGRLLSSRGQPTLAGVFDEAINRHSNWFEESKETGKSTFVVTLNQTDAVVKHHLVEAVVHDLLMSEEEFERRSQEYDRKSSS